MKPKNSGVQVRVWVPSVPLGNWPASVAVTDTFGREYVVGPGPYCFFEDAGGKCRLGIAAVVVKTLPHALYMVRFRDGTEVITSLDSPHQWEPPAGQVAA